jgi:hypothetical protein
VQPVAFAEGAAGFVEIANERDDRIAAREYAADDLAADAAGGADHCGRHRGSFRQARMRGWRLVRATPCHARLTSSAART